jgi:DME family drug/metabolite transporter
MNTPRQASASWGFVFVALSAILFGSLGVTTRGIFAVSQSDALSITLWRDVLTSVPLVVVGMIVLRRKLFAIRGADLRVMIFAGLMLAMYQVAFAIAVQLVNVTIATLVTLCTVPVCVALLSTALLHEKLHRNIWLALACALVGVVLLVGLQPNGDLGSNIWLGVGLALLTAIGSSLFQLTGRTLANNYHPLQTLAIFFVVAVVALLPLSAINGLYVAYPPVGWLLLVYLGVGISIVGYAFLMLGLRTTPATTTTIIGLLEPLTGTTLAVILFNEQLSSTGLAGAVLLLGAMVIVFRTNTRVIEPIET